MEKYTKTRSRFSRKSWNFFREIETVQLYAHFTYQIGHSKIEIVIFRANSRKVSHLMLVEEGLKYHSMLKNLVRFDIENIYEH